MHQIEVAYLGLEVPEPASLSSFFGDVVGLVGGESAPGATAWRNDGKAYRISVHQGVRNDASYVGFEAVDAAAFDATVARLRAAGYDVAEGTSEDCSNRKVARLSRTPAPWGVSIEVVLGLADAPSPYESPLVPGGYLTEGLGFGHVVFATTDFDGATRFLVDGLGLAQSDWLEMELGPGVVLEVRFFHCNGRHHTVALAKVPFEVPQQLHHFMVETIERDAVGLAFDRAWASGLPIPSGLGRHPNDGMFSFYVQSPAGFQVEIGHDGRIVTEPWTDNRRYERISSWGHQPLRQG